VLGLVTHPWTADEHNILESLKSAPGSSKVVQQGPLTSLLQGVSSIDLIGRRCTTAPGETRGKAPPGPGQTLGSTSPAKSEEIEPEDPAPLGRCIESSTIRSDRKTIHRSHSEALYYLNPRTSAVC